MTAAFRLFFALFLSLLASHAVAQEIVYATPLAPVTLSELQTRGADDEPRERRVRQHERRDPLGLWLAGPMSGVASIPSAVPTIAPPPIVASFSSIREAGWVPADAAGAVGKEYVVGMTNAGVIVHKRNGEQVGASVPLYTFMAATPGDPNHDYYDPRIAYDASSDRWVMACIRNNGEHLMIAASRSGDPQGTWDRYQLRYDVFSRLTIDFLRMAVTRDTVMISALDGGTPYPTNVLSLRKTDLYAGAAAPLPIKTYRFDTRDVTPVEGVDSPIEYVMPSFFEVQRLDRYGSNFIVIVETTCAGCFYDIGAPQKGSTHEIFTGYSGVEAAVLRNGAMYVVGTVSVGTPRHLAVRWSKFNPESGKLLDSGFIDDPTGEMFYAFPSLAVNRAGEMLIGFCTFSRNQFASAGYAYRDPAGRVSTAGSIRMGESVLIGVGVTSQQPYERWGDYTTTVIDPIEDSAFWTIQMISQSGSTWRTWWAKIDTPASKQRAVRHR